MPGEVKQQLFSATEAAIILGCSTATVWRDIRAGRLETVHLGGRTSVKGSCLDQLIDGAEPRRQTGVGPIEPKPKPKAKPEIAKPKHERRTARERLETAALAAKVAQAATDAQARREKRQAQATARRAQVTP